MTLEELLIKHEGLKSKPYRDTVGKLTIAVGRNLDDVGLTTDECLYLLRNDIARVTKELHAAFPWFVNLDFPRQCALIDMSFMGVEKLKGFHKLLAALERKDWGNAVIEMLDSKWADQVGSRATDLAQIIRTGIFP